MFRVFVLSKKPDASGRLLWLPRAPRCDKLLS